MMAVWLILRNGLESDELARRSSFNVAAEKGVGALADPM
jgi:hypothetical protein